MGMKKKQVAKPYISYNRDAPLLITILQYQFMVITNHHIIYYNVNFGNI